MAALEPLETCPGCGLVKYLLKPCQACQAFELLKLEICDTCQRVKHKSNACASCQALEAWERVK